MYPGADHRPQPHPEASEVEDESVMSSLLQVPEAAPWGCSESVDMFTWDQKESVN